MKSFAVITAGLIALASAQDLSSLPSCATSCAASAIGATGCAVTDAKCVCSNNTFLSSVQSCIATACSPADQQKTLQFAVSYCQSGGVTITLPTGSTIPATSAPASSTPAPASTTHTSSVSVVSQISDGQPQAPTSASPATFTGAAMSGVPSWMGQAVGLGALVVAAL